MAASSPGQDVKDPGYRNWLKVGQALWYMKRSLHSFVRNEVNLIHRFLICTIYGGTTVQHSQCTGCKASDIRQHKYTHAWGFITPPCPALCHDWLTELLNLFVNPHSDRIYWSNCDVTSWAYNPWECAKAFMPMGQKPTNTDPIESDAQALLTLMANCKHFHGFLSSLGLRQTHKVSTVRNNIMHAPQMKLTDVEMKSCIQEIIDLLEDPVHLHSLPECIAAVSDIKKIRDASVDVFLDLELDIRALRELQGEAIEKLQNELVSQKCNSESTHQELDLHKSDLDGIHQEMDSHKSDLYGLHQEMDSQKSDLEVIHKQAQLGKRKCDTRHRQMHSKVIKLSESGKTVSACLTNLQQNVDNRFSTVQENFESMDARLDRTHQRVTLLESYGYTRGLMQPTEEDVKDIQQLLIKAYESVQIISISPVFHTAVNFKDLEDFYTDIVIEEEREESAQRRMDKQQVDKEKVTSFRQIFEKGDKKVTRIILKAPAGQGKSTFCRKLVHTWCSVQKKKLNLLIDPRSSDKSKTNGLKDEDEMLRFDVLLYICLRDISDEKTLMDVIYTQFPLHESQGLSHKSHIEALIGQVEDNKVLLIMDGLDEMDSSSTFIKQIMQRSLYPHLTVLATTRPWKIDELGLIRSNHIDLLLDLQGFSYENSMSFAKRIFDKYYKDESAIEQFKWDIRTNKVIKSLINVPLLLLFIVHVWYERKSFPKTIHELYLEILNVMVNRYMEGKERKQKSMGRQDEKKYVVLKTWPLESTAFILPQKLIHLLLVKHFGEGFLAALCEVANHFLITDAEETSLVFEEKVLVELLGKDGLSKLQTALDLGILSNSDSPGIFSKKICLTFLHKTVQELLAAINICCREDRCNIFLDSLNTLDDVFQNEMIIMFVAGISTSHCQKIFEKIYEVCEKDIDKDMGKDGARISWDRHYHMKLLCGLYRDCIREACREPISLKAHSLDADNQEDWNVLQSALMNTSDARTHLKRLTLCSCMLDDATFDFSEYISLTELILYAMKGKLLLSKCTHLKCLRLSDCNLDDATMDLSESNCLMKLSLCNVTMKGKLLLSKCTQLRSLKMAHCKLYDATLDLSKSNHLEYLGLKWVTIEGKMLLSKCTQLKCLILYVCQTRLDDTIVDLSESNCLEYLCLVYENVTKNGKLLPSKCTQLRCLKLTSCSLDDATLDLLGFNCLTELCLGGMTMEGKLLPSKFTQLQNLKLSQCTFHDAVLDLSEPNCLRMFLCYDVTMTGRSKVLLSKCTKLECLKMVKCSLGEFALDLSWSTCLNYLFLKNVTVTSMSKFKLSDCTKIECPQLQIANQLLDTTLDYHHQCPRYIYIHNMVLDDTPDLSDSANSNFSRRNVKLCDGIQEMLCSIISQSKRPCTLSLKNLDLSDALLNLEKLYDVTINNVTMCKDGYEMLCTELTYLSLANLDLDNVTMVKNRKVMLFKSLSKSQWLRTLSIKNMNLDDALLSYCNFHSLRNLELDNVTISIDSKMMLFVILSQFEQLTILSLKNLDLTDGLHELYNMNSLTEVIIDNVEMGKISKVLMCNSLSQCTKLWTLSLANLDLGDALLSLDKMEELVRLELVNITSSLQCADQMKSNVQQLKYHHYHELIVKVADSCEKCVMNCTSRAYACLCDSYDFDWDEYDEYDYYDGEQDVYDSDDYDYYDVDYDTYGIFQYLL